MATFWERAAHSVNHVSSWLSLVLFLVVSYFGFEGRTLVLIASVPGYCLPFTFYLTSIYQQTACPYMPLQCALAYEAPSRSIVLVSSYGLKSYLDNRGFQPSQD